MTCSSRLSFNDYIMRKSDRSIRKLILALLVASFVGASASCATNDSSEITTSPATTGSSQISSTITVPTTSSAPVTSTEVSSETEKPSSSELTSESTEITTDVTSESSSDVTSEETSESSSEDTSEITSTEQSEPSEVPTASGSSDPSDPEVKELVVHFIDVGQGDASLIICDGEAMLIDGGASDKSELIYAYLQKHEITHLKYIVATHPDDDHIGGLAAALNIATVERAFCSVDEYDSRPFSSFQKYLNKQKVELEIPEPQEKLELGGATVTFLAPIEKLESTNNNSIVISLEYGKNSFLFTGDAEYEEENTILFSDAVLKSDVLKVGHHGSEYSTSEDFLDAVDPQYAVISCGRENSYGFPKQSVLDLLKERDLKLYRTDLHGDILFYCDGETITVSTENETDGDVFLGPVLQDPDPGSDADCDYVVNTNSRKFHYPYCDSVRKMKESNKWYFKGDRQELIDEGYTPCRNCKP